MYMEVKLLFFAKGCSLNFFLLLSTPKKVW